VKLISVKVAFLLCCIALFWSCRHDPEIPATPEVSFSHDVQAIITGNCTQSGCHEGNTGGGEDLFPLVTYNDIIEQVNKGNGRDSRIYQAITGKGGTKLMPPSPQAKLTDDQIGLIYVWIEQGAKNN
jgi:hypothetical protein